SGTLPRRYFSSTVAHSLALGRSGGTDSGATGSGSGGTGSGSGGTGSRPGATGSGDADGDGDRARERLALAQTALVSALVAGTPAPEGFDPRRLREQRRALLAKRASVVARIAPELPEILGDGFRPAFLAYARERPMRNGYRKDALSFAEHLLIAGGPADERARRRLAQWWESRVAPRDPRRARRIVRAARALLVRR
ncbi:DUF692 domain-containing protein, partial [Streptomyces sp. NPDC000594]